MPTSLEEALQRAIVARLKSDPVVAAFVAARVFDTAPADTAFPWIGLGEIQTVDDGADDLDEAAEATATLHAWSRAVGLVEPRALVGAMRKALLSAALDLGDDWRDAGRSIPTTSTFLDADGKTGHGVVTLRVLADPTFEE
jgi:hypothetical protein